MEFVLLYITARNREEAISLSHELLNERLIACANITEHAISMYWWQGEIEQTPECIIIAKTRKENAEKVTARVKQLHSYGTSCVLVLPVIGGNPDYMDWLRKETHKN